MKIDQFKDIGLKIFYGNRTKFKGYDLDYFLNAHFSFIAIN